MGRWLGLVMVRRGQSIKDDINELQSGLPDLSHSGQDLRLDLRQWIPCTQKIVHDATAALKRMKSSRKGRCCSNHRITMARSMVSPRMRTPECHEREVLWTMIHILPPPWINYGTNGAIECLLTSSASPATSPT